MNIRKLSSLTACIALLSCLTVQNVHASTVELENAAFIQSIGGSKKDVFNDGIENSRGEIFAVGYTSSSSDLGSSSFGSDDGIVTKFNADGTTAWTKRIGGTGRDRLTSVVLNADDSITVAGRSKSTDNGFSTNGGYDAIISKIDSTGKILWTTNIGGSVDENFNDIILTSDGGYLAVGETNSTDTGVANSGLNDIFVTKFDAAGKKQWSNLYGGSDEDIASSVIEVDDGFIIAGNSKSKDGGFVNNGFVDAIVVKINKSGALQWIKSFGGSPHDSFRSVSLAKDGFICAGETYSKGGGIENNGPSGTRDAVIVKYDKLGNEEWIKTFGGSTGEVFTEVIRTHTGGYMAIGYSDSTDAGYPNKGAKDSILVQYDENGNQVKVNGFGGSGDEEIDKAKYTQDGSIIFFGESSSPNLGFDAKGDRDAVVFKYNISIEEAVTAVAFAEETKKYPDIDQARTKVNVLPTSTHKSRLNARIDAIVPEGDVTPPLDKKSATANVDMYIKSENMISLTLDTNSITFEDFSGVTDLEKTNAINMTINSSLPYEINAYLPAEIQNADKTKLMDREIFNIKSSSDTDYKTFSAINSRLNIVPSQPAANNAKHSIDLKLKGGLAFEKDNYKATLKLEVNQL